MGGLLGIFDFIRADRSADNVLRRSFTLAAPPFWMGGGPVAAGEIVTEHTSMGMTAVYRAVGLISGTIASLPLHSYRELKDGSREKVSSWLDDPGVAQGMTRFEWVETLIAHLLLHGNAYGLHVYNGGGALIGMQLLHPDVVSVEADAVRPAGRIFRVQAAQGPMAFTEQDLTHFRSLSTDGVKGYSPIGACRNAVGSGIAADKAAARMYSNGLLLGGVMSVPEDMDEDQAKEIQAGLQSRLGGSGKAGEIAVINAAVDFKPWTMNASDAQFIESRGFQVEEIARLYGVPKVLLAEDGASTWGSGINELIRGFQKFTLAPLTSRIEQNLSRTLPSPRFVEFDFAGLLQPDHAQVVANMEAEIRSGLLTQDEGRRILNRPPLGAPVPPDPSTNDQVGA